MGAMARVDIPSPARYATSSRGDRAAPDPSSSREEGRAPRGVSGPAYRAGTIRPVPATTEMAVGWRPDANAE